jgi:hypothetical protein
MTQRPNPYNTNTGMVNNPVDSPEGADGRGAHGFYGGPSAYATQDERANTMGNYNHRDAPPLPGQEPFIEKGD